MLKEKIQSKQSGILFYGLTPPKATNTKEAIEEITKKHVNRIKPLDIDGLVLYDIQDESDRTSEKRPFPFIKTLDSSTYANEHLSVLTYPLLYTKLLVSMNIVK